MLDYNRPYGMTDFRQWRLMTRERGSAFYIPTRSKVVKRKQKMTKMKGHK